MRTIGFLIAFFICGICSAQERTDPDREAFKLKLFVDTVNFYADDVKAGPYFVEKGVIQIYPGEKLFIDAKVGKDGMLKDMRVVSSPKDSTKMIRVEFNQHANGREHEMMMLSVKNPFDGALEYKALAYFLKPGQWAETSIIPVGARISGFETWADLIVTMALSDWKVRPPK